MQTKGQAKSIIGKTYIEVTNFLHGYIHGEKNDKRKDCSKTSWAEQPECPKIVNCHSIDFLVTVYPSVIVLIVVWFSTENFSEHDREWQKIQPRRIQKRDGFGIRRELQH